MLFTVLASSSKANCALLKTGSRNYLIDCGLSAGKISEELRKLNVQPGDISGVLLTHEHLDHSAGLASWLRTTKAEVYCTEMTARILGVTGKLFTPGESFALDDIEVLPFNVQHDAIDPVGFRFTNSEKTTGWLTDTGRVTQEMEDLLAPCQHLYIESNYDVTMLEFADRPKCVKDRTAGSHGHLSNWRAAVFLRNLQRHNLTSATLLHLSRHCNTPKIAAETVELVCGFLPEIAS